MFKDRLVVLKAFGVLVVGLLASLALAQASVGVSERPHLVDGEGMSLYVFLPDAEHEEGSACYDDCAEAWPPLITDEGTDASDGVDADLLGTIEREDGALQVTYDGWPLYYFVQDEEPGDVAGQGVGENWYLMAPDGTVIGADLEGEGDDAADEGSEMDMAALMDQGEPLYDRHCADCHGADGDEANGSHVVRITEAERTVADPNRLIRQMMYGGAYMPSFGDTFSNDDFIAIATYVRNSFGFDEGPVSREEVVEERERFD